MMLTGLSYDLETESFVVRPSRSRAKSVSTAIVVAAATVQNKDVTRCPRTLFECVDPDSLENIWKSRVRTVEFEFDGMDVMVRPRKGVVELRQNDGRG